MARIVLDERPCNCNECPLSILADCSYIPYKRYVQNRSWNPQEKFCCYLIVTLDELKEERIHCIEEVRD